MGSVRVGIVDGRGGTRRISLDVSTTAPSNHQILDIDASLADGEAFGISAHGTVVGRLKFANQNGQRAFVWSAQTGLKDLNFEIPANSGWLLSDAHAINDRGMIIGNGTLNGAQRGFFLVPIPSLPVPARTPTASRLRIQNALWILFGVKNDAPGITSPGGPVPPFGPWSIDSLMSSESRDLLLTVLAGELGSLVSDAVTATALREASLSALNKLTQRELEHLRRTDRNVE